MGDATVRVALPFEGIEVPEPVVVDLYTGHDGPPEHAADVELYVLPYDFRTANLELMASLPQLRAVQSLMAGYDHVVPYLPDGVALCNARGVHDASTAELALTLTLASRRGVPDFVRAEAAGEWRYAVHPALADSTVLLVGYGNIGAAVERRLAGFEVGEVLRVARTARDGVHAFAELPGLLPRADVVILLVPVTAETTGLVDAAFLARMKDGALLVNVARGKVVDTAALTAEVTSGRLAAALDVTDPEPLPPGHPLWAAPGCLVSPHVGGGSTAFLPRARRLVTEQVARYAAGEPLANVVIPAVPEQ